MNAIQSRAAVRERYPQAHCVQMFGRREVRDRPGLDARPLGWGAVAADAWAHAARRVIGREEKGE